MRTHLQPLAGLVLWGALAVLGRASAAEQNVIRAIDVSERDGGVELAIQGTRAPSYTVFKLQDPPRLVVDLAGADVSQVASPVEVGKAGVVAVSTAQYKDERSAVGRVIVALEGPRRYEVAPKGDAVVVRVLPAAAASAAAGPLPEGTATAAPTATANATPTASATPAATPAATPTPAASATPTASASATPTATPAATPTPAASAAAEPKGEAAIADGHVVSRRVDEVAVTSPAGAVTGVRASPDRILLATDGEVARIEVIELREPARLVVDLHGVARAPRKPVRTKGAFSLLRFGGDAGKVRVVLDAAGALPRYEVRRVRGGVAVVTPAAASAEAAAPAAGKARARISGLRFVHQGGFARILVEGQAPHAVSRPDARTVVLSLKDAELAKRLERSLDTTAFQGPVAMVSSFNQPATGEVKVVATLREEALDRVEETRGGLAWSFQPAAARPGAAPKAPDAPVVTVTEAAAAGFSSEAPGYAASSVPRAAYTGRRITLDFHDIEIRNLLRLIADVSKRNIVVADDVTGKVTVSLRNVPWDQALELILRSKGLGKEELGNVIRVAKYEQIAKEQQARAEAEKARAPLLPLKVRIVPVNFARAEDLTPRVKEVLTERGTVSTDSRTNVLIVKDVQEGLVRAEGLVRNLDAEIPQVLIESRIVEASSNFSRELGVQWGGNAGFAQTTGNPTGLIFPNIAQVAGGAGGGPTTGTAASPGYAVNLPAAIGQGAGGGLGFVFGSAGGAFNLNLRLSALENNGVVKTISAPKIATLDNKEATIGQGLSIPFSQTSAAGVNTVFIEAKLELKVTPHVSADGSILLKIKATNNQPNPQLTGANGQPSISKREAETEVLVKDGETTVIGGIYTRQTATRKNGVPFLSKLPLLGFFFKNTSDQDDHTELLIFITPSILNRSAAVVSTAR